MFAEASSMKLVHLCSRSKAVRVNISRASVSTATATVSQQDPKTNKYAGPVVAGGVHVAQRDVPAAIASTFGPKVGSQQLFLNAKETLDAREELMQVVKASRFRLVAVPLGVPDDLAQHLVRLHRPAVRPRDPITLFQKLSRTKTLLELSRPVNYDQKLIESIESDKKSSPSRRARSLREQTMQALERVHSGVPLWHPNDVDKNIESEGLKMLNLTKRTPVIKYSVRKLNMLARQIKGLTVPQAIEQMAFSPKKPGNDIALLLKEMVQECLEKLKDLQAKATTKTHESEDPTSLPSLMEASKEVEKITSSNFIVVRAYVGKNLTEHGITFHATSRSGKMRRPSGTLTATIGLLPQGCVARNRGNMTSMEPRYALPKLTNRTLPITYDRPIHEPKRKLFYDN